MLVARRKLLRQAVALADIVTVGAGLVVAYGIVGSGFHRNFGSFDGYAWLLVPIVPVWLGCLCAFGLYRSAAYSSAPSLLARLIQAHLLASLLLLSLMYLTRSEAISRLLVQAFLTVSFVLLAAQKLALMAYLDSTRQHPHPRGRRVVLVADAATAERFNRLMRSRVSMFADLVKVMTPAEVEGSSSAGTAAHTSGGLDDLPALLDAQVVDEVIAQSQLDPSVLERLGHWCSVRGTLLRIWLELPCPPIGSWAAEFFGDGAFLLSLAAVPRNPIHLAAKRLVDVVGAALGMIPCGAVYLWCALRLRRETGGSVLFHQLRVGRNGRHFVLHKFRTMALEAEQQKAALNGHNQMSGAMFKIENDPRVTLAGRTLRRRYLDELPQFWNVLRGDMSLVGTRPPTADETALYADRHRRRLSMKPGITGLWQLNGNGKVKDFEDVVKLDCEYIDNWSLWLDAKILARTLTKVLCGGGW